MSTTFPTGFSDLATVADSTKVLADDGSNNGLASVQQLRGAIIKQLEGGGLVGDVGTVLWDSTAVYICIASGVWAKAALSQLAVADTMISGEPDGLAIDFTDDYFFDTTSLYGSARVKDTTTPANTFDGVPYNLLSYTGTTKLTRQSDGVYRYGPHNLYLNSAAPANQSVTVVSGATYEIVITGSVSITWSGAYTGTTTSGTTAFTAASGTLTGASTTGSGTVAVRRTPCSSTYLATTSAARYGLPYEWDTSGVLQGILVEPQATNLLTYSTEFDNVSWLKEAAGAGVAPVVTANAAVSPVGTMDADLIVFNLGGGTTTSDQSAIRKAVSVATAAAYTFSVWLKTSDGSSITLQCRDDAANIFNSNITVTGTWQKFSLPGTSTSTTCNLRMWLRGTLTSASASLHVWGAQLETGSVATSPIITYGSTVTRAADNISLATSAFPLSTVNGTIFAMYNRKPGVAGSAGSVLFELSPSNRADALSQAYCSAWFANLITLSERAAAFSIQAATQYTPTDGVDHKAAQAGKTNDFANSLDGSAAATDTSGTYQATPFTELRIGYGGGSDQLNGYIKKLMYLPRRMSNAELQAITA